MPGVSAGVENLYPRARYYDKTDSVIAISFNSPHPRLEDNWWYTLSLTMCRQTPSFNTHGMFVNCKMYMHVSLGTCDKHLLSANEVPGNHGVLSPGLLVISANNCLVSMVYGCN